MPHYFDDVVFLLEMLDIETAPYVYVATQAYAGTNSVIFEAYEDFRVLLLPYWSLSKAEMKWSCHLTVENLSGQPEQQHEIQERRQELD